MDEASEQDKGAWLQRHAHALRSIDPADTDFSDLETLRPAIGPSRVVLLGEQSHGDGATFSAKVRLIKFLHRELGFDVLLFESGFYDLYKAWGLLAAGAEPYDTFRKSVFGVWSRSAEVQPLIAYLAEQLQTRRPLELAGFDCQFNRLSEEHFLDDLERELASLGATATRADDWARFRTHFEAVVANRMGASDAAPSDGDRNAVLATLRRCEQAFEAAERATGSPQMQLWRQFVESAISQAQGYWLYKDFEREKPGEADEATATALACMNLRDRQMANNLLYLLRNDYAGRKAIVWAASAHNARNYHTIEFAHLKHNRMGWLTMGNWLWDALGDETYNIAFTASEGRFGRVQTTSVPIEAPAVGSLEALLAATTHRLAFLNLRVLAEGGHWLNAPMIARPFGYADARAIWPKIFDGMIYTRAMCPSTRINPG